MPFLPLADEDGRVHKLFGASGRDGSPLPLVYITDRFGEIVSAWDSEHLPSTDEVLKTLEFVNHQFFPEPSLLSGREVCDSNYRIVHG